MFNPPLNERLKLLYLYRSIEDEKMYEYGEPSRNIYTIINTSKSLRDALNIKLHHTGNAKDPEVP